MSGEGLKLEPDAAARIVNACFALSGRIDSLSSLSGTLTSVAASGLYGSGTRTDKKLSELGTLAARAIEMIRGEVDKTGAAARAAGQRLLNQDDENQAAIRRALESPDGVDPLQKALPFNSGMPNPGSQPQIADQPTSPVAPSTPPAAGAFPMNLVPEAIANFSLDPATAALGPAVPSALTTLATQWLQLANQLNAAFFTFDSQISLLGTEVFSGEAASQMKASLDTFSGGGKRVANEAQANSVAISAWAGFVAQSQAQVNALQQGRATALAAATPENALQVHQIFDSLSQTQLSATWNPPLSTMNGSVVNLSDPSSPVAGTALLLPGTGPKPTSSGSNALAAATSASGGSGGAGGGGGGGGSTAAAAKNAAAASSGLQRAGSGDPQPAAAPRGSQSGAQSSNAANPASAMSQAGKSADGLTRGGLGSATKSAGLGSVKDTAAAEKAALAKSALAGKGGGGGGGGAGAAGLGKAGASESALSSRNLSSLAAAERATAAEPAASSRTPAGSAGTPMGGRGASPAGSQSDGKHKSARYLQSKENGEEIVGDLEDVAPMVLGGLNLDTTDDRPAPPTP